MNRTSLLRPAALAAIALMSLAAAACSTTTLSSAPPDLPPPIPPAEMAGLPDVAYSQVVEAAGPPVVSAGRVTKGEALVVISYRYRHTAVLTQDVMGFSITVRGVQARAGAPGYWAGQFSSTSDFAYGRAPRAPYDMWCFLRGEPGSGRDPICLLRSAPALAAIAPTRANPYLWSSFSPITGSFNYVRTPMFERRRVDLPLDLKLEYRFDGWQGDEARIALYAGGRRVVDISAPRDAAGRPRLRTIAGSFLLSKDPGDPAAARVVPAPD